MLLIGKQFPSKKFKILFKSVIDKINKSTHDNKFMKPPLFNEIRKPSKTLAGVTPIAVMCKPKKCRHGTCIYCPSLNVPQSYTPKSPPVLRAERLNYK